MSKVVFSLLAAKFHVLKQDAFGRIRILCIFDKLDKKSINYEKLIKIIILVV